MHDPRHQHHLDTPTAEEMARLCRRGFLRATAAAAAAAAGRRPGALAAPRPRPRTATASGAGRGRVPVTRSASSSTRCVTSSPPTSPAPWPRCAGSATGGSSTPVSSAAPPHSSGPRSTRAGHPVHLRARRHPAAVRRRRPGSAPRRRQRGWAARRSSTRSSGRRATAAIRDPAVWRASPRDLNKAGALAERAGLRLRLPQPPLRVLPADRPGSTGVRHPHSTRPTRAWCTSSSTSTGPGGAPRPGRPVPANRGRIRQVHVKDIDPRAASPTPATAHRLRRASSPTPGRPVEEYIVERDDAGTRRAPPPTRWTPLASATTSSHIRF